MPRRAPFTRGAAQRGFDAVQLEINSRWLFQPGCPPEQMHRAIAVATALARLVQVIAPAST